MSYNIDINELMYMLESGNIDPSVIAGLTGLSLVSNIFSIAVAVLMIIAMWKLFVKAGEAGWKAIIPVYNNYILFKISWKRKWFWISFALSIVIIVLASILAWDAAVYTTGAATGISEETFLTVVGGLTIAVVVLSIPLVVINIVLYWKIAKSFGKGAGYFFGLLFLSVIFFCILGFGSAVYLGPEGKGAPAAAAGYAPQTVGYAPVGTYQQSTANPQQAQVYYAPQAYGQQAPVQQAYGQPAQAYVAQQANYTPAPSSPASGAGASQVTYTPGAVTYGTPTDTPQQ